MTLLRTSLAAPVVACTTGRKTPRTSTVTSTLAIAAKRGIALRLRHAAPRGRRRPVSTLRAPHAHGELARGLAGGVGPRLLVAHDPAVGELDDAPAHLV